MRRGIIVMALLGYSVIALWGCAALKKEKELSSTPLLEPQTMLKFSDIPVPVGFKSLPKDSYSFESGNVRTAVLKYQGKANPDQVVVFYKEQMPMYNWNLLNVIEYGERILNFERENETCIISLSAKGNSISLTISLGPKPRIFKKSEKPLK
ncbi:MAG: hypothetical protein NC928_02255 [Candidatus Omnitrophica bacterium]|nr:hypothetical protein [Candidatus Omnitrophota bacterium]